MYYEMDPSDPTTRMDDVTATFELDITQQGSKITIDLYLNPISWTTDPAYWNEYGFEGVPPAGGGSIDLTGTVSSSSFTASSSDILVSEQLTGTFTTDIITATLTGTSETTDANGIVVTSSTPIPTLSPTSTPAPTSTLTPTPTPTSTAPPTTANDLGSVGLVKGSATLTNAAGQTPITSKSQIGTATQVQTGSGAIVEFNYPDEGGAVYLGENTQVGWVALESHPAPDGTVTFTTLPSNPSSSFNWGEEGQSLLKWTAIGAGAELLLTGAISPYVLGAEVLVHGGIILVHYGKAYIKENGYPQLLQVPQGFLQGENTEYAISVDSNGATVVQVIEGPVVFLDPVTNNTVTVESNQMLTLPIGVQTGFSEQDLQSDISSFDVSTISQWWPVTAVSNQTQDLVVGISVIVIFIVVIVAAVTYIVRGKSKNRKKTYQSSAPVLSSKDKTTSPPPPPTTQQPEAALSAMPIASAASTSQKFAFCPYCGKKLDINAKFCPFCGARGQIK
jgi:hypothetical protein